MSTDPAWFVEADVRDPNTGEIRRVTVICESYDGTADGAGRWAADVFDWCDVYDVAIHRINGVLVEAREHGRLDEPHDSADPRVRRREPVTVTIPASGARLAADHLYQAMRDARQHHEPGIADQLEQVAGQLHAAGWKAART